MAIPAPFGLTTTESTLGDNYGTLLNSAPATETTNLTTGSIFEITWKAPSTTLGDNFNTGFSSGSLTSIQNINFPAIYENLWVVPTTSLGQNLNTLSTTVPSSTSITIPTAGALTSFGYVLPSMSLSVQFSTFIYTKDVPITISAAAEQTSTQIWYSS
jgi:hypothetical protein